MLPLEDIPVLEAATTTVSTVTGSEDESHVAVQSQISYMQVHDHSYASRRLSCLLENIVCYIAGTTLPLTNKGI